MRYRDNVSVRRPTENRIHVIRLVTSFPGSCGVRTVRRHVLNITIFGRVRPAQSHVNRAFPAAITPSAHTAVLQPSTYTHPHDSYLLAVISGFMLLILLQLYILAYYYAIYM